MDFSYEQFLQAKLAGPEAVAELLLPLQALVKKKQPRRPPAAPPPAPSQVNPNSRPRPPEEEHQEAQVGFK